MEEIILVDDKNEFGELSKEEMAKAIQMWDVMKDTIRKPTEIWRRDNKRFYLKAYKDFGSVMVVVEGEQFSQMFKISVDEAEANRFGELLYPELDNI